MATVKPIASGGLENRNPRPKVHEYCLFLGSNRENFQLRKDRQTDRKQTQIRYSINKTKKYYKVWM